ncbi:hypothetical protein EC988_000705, partial [Linderina pennispora]
MTDMQELRAAVKSRVGGIDGAVDAVVDRFADYIRLAAAGDAAEMPAGVILSGIPGCGKSKLAQEFARGTGLAYLTVHCPDLFSADHGRSESNLLTAFAAPAGAKSEQPRVLILEEIDVLGGSAKPESVEARMLSLLLSLLSSSGVFVVGTTTRLQAIPPEVRRPGRLHTIVEVHLADTGARAKALGIILENFETIAP